MLSKVKKSLLMILGSVAFTGTTLILNNKVANLDTTNSYWYNNLFNEKFQVRDQIIHTESLPNGQTINIQIDNGYELKLLLNPGFESEQVDFIQEFNNEFIQKILKNNLKFTNSVQSRIMPIIYFYFENEKERENFARDIKDFQEVFRIILFKNELKQESVWGNDPGFEYYRKTYSNLNIAPTKNIADFKKTVAQNVEIIKGDVGMYNHKVGKIGVIEPAITRFDSKYSEFFKGGIKVNDSFVPDNLESLDDYHATTVSMIVGGQFGVDKTSTVYLSKFYTNGQWQKAIEKLVLDEGVRLINHSYGPDIDIPRYYYDLYNGESYYLDYISRKYGVINFISAGNDGKNKDHQVGGNKLSFNSVVVGALNGEANSRNTSKNMIANYSNFNLETKYSDLPKPLLVAPGSFNNIYYEPGNWEKQKIINGTSYATPLVTGIVSNFLKLYPGIDTSEFRVPIIKSILSASALTPKLTNLQYKSSGYEQKYGAGTVDGVKMNEAARNYRTLKVNPNSGNGTVFASSSIYLNTNQTIKVSSSWLFNAGILKENEKRPQQRNSNWWNSFLNFFSISRQKNQEEERRKINEQQIIWDSTHYKNSETQLTFQEAWKRQGGKWFTDYDLFLEYQEPNGKWVEVKKVNTVNTNDELIEHNVTKSGLYRYIIKKFGSRNFNNSVDDLVAVTHVVQND